MSPLFHCQQGRMGFSLSAVSGGSCRRVTGLICTQRPWEPHTANPVGFLMRMETGMALVLMGNKNANQEGIIIATCNFITGSCCMLSPELPWAIPGLDAVAFQNSIVCLLPSCQETKGSQAPTSSLRISWHWE